MSRFPLYLSTHFFRPILKDYSLRSKLFFTEIPTSIIRFRLERVLHHSSKELRKRFATAVHPSEASKRCLEPYFASQFVLIRPCISGTDLPSDAATSGFQLPWTADISAVENGTMENVLLSCVPQSSSKRPALIL